MFANIYVNPYHRSYVVSLISVKLCHISVQHSKLTTDGTCKYSSSNLVSLVVTATNYRGIEQDWFQISPRSIFSGSTNGGSDHAFTRHVGNEYGGYVKIERATVS